MINPAVFFTRYFIKAVSAINSLALMKVSLVWDNTAQDRVDEYAEQTAEVIGEIMNRSSASPLVHFEALYRWLCEYRDSLPLNRPLTPRPIEVDD